MLVAIVLLAVIALAAITAALLRRLRDARTPSTREWEQHWNGSVELLKPRDRRRAERRALERRVMIGVVTQERRSGVDRRAADRRHAGSPVSDLPAAHETDRRAAAS